MTRDEAFGLVCEFTKSDSLRKHMLAVEAAMVHYAHILGEDETEFEKLSEAATDCASEARARLNDPQECLHQRQFMTMFDTCLAKLPPNQARAFMLRHWHEETSSDICIKLGVTTVNLNVMLHRARSRLRVSISAQ